MSSRGNSSKDEAAEEDQGYNDEYIAMLLADEAKKQSQLAEKYGPTAYLVRMLVFS
jgi:hypothetical protein